MNWADVEARIASPGPAGARSNAKRCGESIDTPAEALELVVAGWRARRCAPYADLVDAIAAQLPVMTARAKARGTSLSRDDRANRVAAEMREAGKSVAQILAALKAEEVRAPYDPWPARAAAASAAELGPLLATLAKAPETGRAYLDHARVRHVAWLARVAALAARPADPRIATALVAAIRTARLTLIEEAEARVVYAPALALIEALADERAAAPLRALLERPVSKRAGVRAFLAAALPEAIAALPAPPPLRTRDASRCAALLAQLVPERIAATPARDVDEPVLLAQVAANLADDGPRTVLADHWIENGDPRGELVALQLRGRKPGRTLLRAVDATLGELARVTKNRVYARGFLDTIELMNNACADSSVWHAAAHAPQLATVREIAKGAANETLYAMFVGSPEARSLATLVTLSKAMLADACARAVPWPVTEIWIGHAVDVATLTRLARSTAFPHLTTLTFAIQPKAFGVLFRDRGWCTTRRSDGAMRVEIRGQVCELLAAHLAGSRRSPRSPE